MNNQCRDSATQPPAGSIAVMSAARPTACHRIHSSRTRIGEHGQRQHRLSVGATYNQSRANDV